MPLMPTAGPWAVTDPLQALRQCSNLRAREEPVTQPVCPCLGLHNLCAGVPDAILLLKHKMLEHAKPPVVKAAPGTPSFPWICQIV